MKLQELPRPFTVLAPMDDVTETVFRQIIASCAPPDLYFTEFVNVDALQSAGRQSAMKRLQFTDTERPLIAQIWGTRPENFYKTAAELVEMGFDGVDLNMGCPDKAVVRNGCCGGLIQYPDRALQIIAATRDGLAGGLPLSVKTRIGFREYDEEWLGLLLKEKLNMLSIHLRTVREMSKVPAHWEMAAKVRELRDNIAPDTLLVGNGDVASYSQATELAKRYKLDGIMIGRGIFHDPFVFARQSPWPDYTPAQKIDLYRQHLTLFAQQYPVGERKFDTIKKFCKLYISDFDGASALRAKLMEAKNVDDSLQILRNV